MKTDKTNLKSKTLLKTEDCCVYDIGLAGFAECQMSGPNLCPYAMPFGYSFLCQHPHVDKIIANNKARQPAPFLKVNHLRLFEKINSVLEFRGQSFHF